MKNTIKKLLIVLLLSFFMWLMVSSTFEFVSIRIKINDFIKKGVYDEELSTKTRRFYQVRDEEKRNYKKAFLFDENNIFYPGSEGDILCTLESPFRDIPFLHQITSFFVGGHVAVVGKNYEDEENKITEYDVIETFGNSELSDDNRVFYQRNYFNHNNYRSSYLGLRINNITPEENSLFVDNLISSINTEYNYLYFFYNKPDRYYCTDLVTRNLIKVNSSYDLNYDYLAVTVNDLVVSSQTYIFLYKYLDNNNIEHIYYLI